LEPLVTMSPEEDLMPLAPWSTNARNLPEHAHNIIHTDLGAHAAGFPGALVAGTTVFAYLTHVPASAWGMSWLTAGSSEVRFRSPVFEDDLVQCVPTETKTGEQLATVVEARVDDQPKASCRFALVGDIVPDRLGDPLPQIPIVFDDDLARYGLRAGDDLDLYEERGIVHPAAWPTIGNRVTIANFVNGPWIHVRSHITHLGLARFGSTATVTSTLRERFDSRAGERVIIDIRVTSDGEEIAAIEHESIIRLAS
jgi:hypothetical protein